VPDRLAQNLMSPHHRVAGPLVSEISVECHSFSEADD
jgi:hypothetical protein